MNNSKPNHNLSGFHLLDMQIESASSNIPSRAQFQNWLDVSLADLHQPFEVLIRVVDEPEMTELNQNYRHKIGSTNILSFPFETPDDIAIDLNLLGDLVICAPVIEREALEQAKFLEHHWAHIVIHGIFHLLGYDHIDENEAEAMERLEIDTLRKLNINNPYQEHFNQ